MSFSRFGLRLVRATVAKSTVAGSRGFSLVAHQGPRLGAGLLSASFQSKKFSTGTGSLPECLANEIAGEAADDEVDQEYIDIKAQIEKLFSIKEELGKGVVTLTRSAGGESIEVTFDVQDEAELEPDMEALEQEMKEGEDDEAPEMEFGINFDITITKKGGEKLVASCVASQNLVIESVRFVPAGVDPTDETLYGGPVFEHLDEVLQDAFYGYLADRKIDEDLCFFILSHSRQKEQKEYTNWLNKLLEFSEK
jgi:complement component 1 Q subcomponent-binding protein